MSKWFRGFGGIVKKVAPPNLLEDKSVKGPEVLIGKKILAYRNLGEEAEEIVVEDVKGCLAPHLGRYFQINGKYLVSMLSAYLQVLEGRLPTEVEEQDFFKDSEEISQEIEKEMHAQAKEKSN